MKRKPGRQPWKKGGGLRRLWKVYKCESSRVSERRNADDDGVGKDLEGAEHKKNKKKKPKRKKKEEASSPRAAATTNILTYGDGTIL